MLFQEIKEELLGMFEKSEYLDSYELDILKEEFNDFYRNEIYPFYNECLKYNQHEQLKEMKKLVNRICENVA